VFRRFLLISIFMMTPSLYALEGMELLEHINSELGHGLMGETFFDTKVGLKIENGDCEVSSSFTDQDTLAIRYKDNSGTKVFYFDVKKDMQNIVDFSNSLIFKNGNESLKISKDARTFRPNEYQTAEIHTKRVIAGTKKRVCHFY